METKMNMKIVRKLFTYDKKRGKLIWKNPPNIDNKGKIADHVMTNGHHVVSVYGKYFGVNRIIWMWHYGEFPDRPIVNIDGNKNNTHINNLQESDSSGVMIRSGNTIANSSGIKGVSWNGTKRRWNSQIFIDGKNYFLGWFKSFDAAVYTRYAAEQCLLKEEDVSISPAHQYVMRVLKK